MISDIFDQSIDHFFGNESKHILSGVSERNLCARLALELQNLAHENGLEGYYVDPEYNRKQNGRIKTILDDDMKVVNITCDLILHSRGEIMERDNLIAIEMKKSNRPEEEKEDDRNRLRALTKSSYDDVWSFDGISHPEHVCGYEIGYFVEIDLENQNYTVQKFEKGELTGQNITSFGL